jgi:hypothetical protein
VAIECNSGIGHINIASTSSHRKTPSARGQVMCLSSSSNFQLRTKNLVVEGDRDKDTATNEK